MGCRAAGPPSRSSRPRPGGRARPRCRSSGQRLTAATLTAVALLEFGAGLVLVAWVLNDVFNTVILPRPSPVRYRPAGLLTRWSWTFWRRYADTSRTPEHREQRLG